MSLLCSCGYGMHNTDDLNSIELSLFRKEDILDAIRKGVKLVDLELHYEETEVWRCPKCKRWTFISKEFPYVMIPVKEFSEDLAKAQDDDVLFIEFDMKSQDNAFGIREDILVHDFLELPDSLVRIRYIRLNSRRMLLFRNFQNSNPVKIYLREE